MEEKEEDVEAAEAITFALGSAPEKCELACGYELNTRQQLLSAGAGAGVVREVRTYFRTTWKERRKTSFQIPKASTRARLNQNVNILV